MKILIAEDDKSQQISTQQAMEAYGKCDFAVNGIEAVDAFLKAWDETIPYELICLDIIMPRLDGLKTLKIIRDLEKDKKISRSERVKIIMTTALNDRQTICDAFTCGCEAFITKPINMTNVLEVFGKLGIETLE